MVIELMILALAAFLIGYIAGKVAGRKAGYREGVASAPLLLRQHSLEQGACCFCQPKEQNHEKYFIKE